MSAESSLVAAEGGVARGTSKSRLLEILGLPTEIVAPDTWIYRDFYHPHPVAVREGYDTLIVGVVDDRVTVIKLVNGRALDRLLKANAEAKAAKNRMLAQAEARPPR